MELPREVSKRLPRYPNVPATLLGRLAVSVRRRGLGLGEFLLMDALCLSFKQSGKVASAAVVVDAKDQAARRFYLKYGFLSLANDRGRLFLPMRTAERLVTGGTVG